MNLSKKVNLKNLRILMIGCSCLLMGLFASKDLKAQNNTPQLQQQQQVKTDFSDKQLKAFVSADKKLAPIQQQSQQKMMKSIKDEGLTVQRFNEIAREKQQKKKSDASTKEEIAFNKAAQEVLKQKKATNAKMTTIIKNQGLNVQTFQQIAYAYQQSPKVQKKIQSMMKQK